MEDLYVKIYEEHFKCNNEKTKSPMKKWAKDMNRHLPKEYVRTVNKYMKRDPLACVIREMQMRFQYELFRTAKIWNTTNTKC